MGESYIREHCTTCATSANLKLFQNEVKEIKKRAFFQIPLEMGECITSSVVPVLHLPY
jgi:hypothetical protein